MSSAVTGAWIGSMFALAVVWLALVFWLFRRLRLRHPATYEVIGSPSLFWNNSLRNNWLFLKFLWQGHWQGLGDAQLALVARAMQVLFVVYTVGFAALFVALMALGTRPA